MPMGWSSNWPGTSIAICDYRSLVLIRLTIRTPAANASADMPHAMPP